MSKEYKSTDKRLVAYFKSSRDKWKARSHKYQIEKRKSDMQVRDLKKSRDSWREECLLLRQQLRELQEKKKKRAG